MLQSFKVEIRLRPHLKIRLKQRGISQDYPRLVLERREEKYFDTATNHYIAVRKLEYNGKVRPMAVSYDIINKVIQVITIHPITDQEIKNKLKRNRWQKYEKD